MHEQLGALLGDTSNLKRGPKLFWNNWFCPVEGFYENLRAQLLFPAAWCRRQRIKSSLFEWIAPMQALHQTTSSSLCLSCQIDTSQKSVLLTDDAETRVPQKQAPPFKKSLTDWYLRLFVSTLKFTTKPLMSEKQPGLQPPLRYFEMLNMPWTWSASGIMCMQVFYYWLDTIKSWQI